jgi:hypothetical protein
VKLVHLVGFIIKKPEGLFPHWPPFVSSESHQRDIFRTVINIILPPATGLTNSRFLAGFPAKIFMCIITAQVRLGAYTVII